MKINQEKTQTIFFKVNVSNYKSIVDNTERTSYWSTARESRLDENLEFKNHPLKQVAIVYKFS